VDLAAVVGPEVVARRTADLVVAETGGGRERQQHAAQPLAPGAVRDQLGPFDGRLWQHPPVTSSAPEPRPRAVRRADALHRLEHDVDLWLATADPDGTPRLLPLSFHWDGTSIVVATRPDNPTGRNLARNREVQLALGHPRDVVLLAAAPADLGTDCPQADAFAVRADWDPRLDDEEYHFYRLTPRWLRAWRESNELAGRQLMREGAWLY
jgi:hypothetical protein